MKQRILKVLKNRDFQACAFLVLVAFTMLGANPFTETVAPMDLLLHRPGWRNAELSLPSIHPERSDPLDAKLPGWISAKKWLRRGSFPFLNYTNAGRPNYSFTRSLWTPGFLAFCIPESNATGFYLANFVNCVLGMLGMYFFLRLFFGRGASVFGAYVFMFSGFNIAWFFWQHVNTAVTVPWVFFSVFAFLEKKDWRYLPLVTLSMLMLNLGGFPMVAVMAYMALAVMLAVYMIYSDLPWISRLTSLVLIGVYGFLAAVAAFPFVIPLLYTFRRIGGIGYRHGGTIYRLADLKLFILSHYRPYMVEKTLYAGIIPCILILAAVFFHFRRKSWISKAFLLTFLMGLTIAFALINADIIRMIPTLNKNPWNRFSFLIDTSMAMLSAYALHQIVIRIKSRKTALLVIAVLFSLQYADMSSFFRKYNRPVPNEAFYPVTPSIKFMQDNLKPFQYVIADSGYLLCGTLGAYGLNEWFAHTFHSPQTKKILGQIVRNPFQTPTSSAFSTSQVITESPYIDFLNNKFITATKGNFGMISSPLWNRHNHAKQPVPDLPANKLRQFFSVRNEKELYGISVQFATYGRKHPFSGVVLKLMHKDKVLAEKEVSEKEVSDNLWTDFVFPSPVHLKPGTYSFSIEVAEPELENHLTIWAAKEKSTSFLKLNGKRVNLVLHASLLEKRPGLDKYTVHNIEPGIQIVENNNVKGGAYFIKSKNLINSPMYDKVVTEQTSNSLVKVENSYDGPGWIVLPVRNFKGWTVIIDGKKQKPDDFLGIMPAVRVNGPGEVIFKYVPPYFIPAVTAAVIALLTAFGSFFIFLKNSRKTPCE